MTKPGTAQPDTKRRRASTGRMMDEIMELARQLPLTRQVLADQLETATPAQMEFIHTWMLAELEVVPEVLRKSGWARCRVGFSRLSAWCHRGGTCPGSGGPSSRR